MRGGNKLQAFANYMELVNENQDLNKKVIELEARLLKAEQEIGKLKHSAETMMSTARDRCINARKMGM